MPGRSAVRRSRVVRPGIMSTLPPRLGTQKLWMTSAAFRINSIGLPTGMVISFALANGVAPS